MKKPVLYSLLGCLLPGQAWAGDIVIPLIVPYFLTRFVIIPFILIEAGRTLQRGLNEAGAAKADYEPLKEDNDIGEKTTDAFNRLKEDDEEGLLASFSKNDCLAGI